jgi:hypothetical protein
MVSDFPASSTEECFDFVSSFRSSDFYLECGDFYIQYLIEQHSEDAGN